MNVLINFVLGILSLLIFFLSFLLWRYRQKSQYQAKTNFSMPEQNLNSETFDQIITKLEREKSEILNEKQKTEEKNKKLWTISETVHKERKLVDEANEKLSQEKEKLETEKKKLDEKVKKLWSTSTAIHKEKERINELKLEIEHKHQEILDSVNYAQRIQRALLASSKLLKSNLPEHFVLFLPKDIVSGDFYWAQTLSSGVFSIVTADSTGHGVPGAIMSILNISCLGEAVNAQKLILPDQILNYTRQRIMEHMANDGSEEGGKDGMDAVICNFDFSKNKLQFAAANNPLWLIRNNELTEFKPDKMPVGKAMGETKPFTLQEIDLKKGDLIISLTDGYADQFGGPKGKKFMYKPLKELLLSINQEPLTDIKLKLNEALNDWKAGMEQVDDILLIGVRVA